MKAEYCSIFTVKKGFPDDEDCLVLRKTNYENKTGLTQKNKLEENSSYYKRDEQNKYLTAYVWANSESLIINDIMNQQDLYEKYKITRSEGKYNDSDDHKGFLAVPIINHKKNVIGVIRMPHKKREEGREIPFTNRDLFFLTYIAQQLDYVIERQDFLDQIKREKILVNAAQHFAHVYSNKQVIKLLVEYASSLFGGESNKAYFINRYTPLPKNSRWVIKEVKGELPINSNITKRKFSIYEGLTGSIIRDKEMQPKLLHNLEDINSASRKGYIEIVKNGKSVIIAPLKSKTKIYGTLAIVSNRKFCFSENDLQILSILAEIGGNAIVRTRCFYIKEVMKWIWDLKYLLISS